MRVSWRCGRSFCVSCGFIMVTAPGVFPIGPRIASLGPSGALPRTPPGALPLDPTKGHRPLEPGTFLKKWGQGGHCPSRRRRAARDAGPGQSPGLPFRLSWCRWGFPPGANLRRGPSAPPDRADRPAGTAWRDSRPSPPPGSGRGRPRRRSPSAPRSACAGPAGASCARIAAVASNPSMSGIWQSISTRSKRSRRQPLQRLAPVRGGLHRAADPAQHAQADQQVHLVVLDQQHARPAMSRRPPSGVGLGGGRRAAPASSAVRGPREAGGEAEGRPLARGRCCTEMLPPISSHRWRDIASPSPVPP